MYKCGIIKVSNIFFPVYSCTSVLVYKCEIVTAVEFKCKGMIESECLTIRV